MPSLRPYPKPGPIGGSLIRKVIADLKVTQTQLPIDSHILCAVSGGGDSMALLTLLAKYGRRVVGRERVKVIHFNHHLRGLASDRDQRAVERASRKWGLECLVRDLEIQKEASRSGRSLEEVGHAERYKVFREYERQGYLIMTAHTADDLVETLLWRLFTGQAQTKGGGIWYKQGGVLRPLLGVRKEVLRKFLKEEQVKWREDKTNQDIRFLRAYLRKKVIPQVESRFPRAIEHLVKEGLAAQGLGLKFTNNLNSLSKGNLTSRV